MMKSVSGLMSDYFSERSAPAAGLMTEAVVPIEVRKSEWKILRDPERMIRVYSFEKKPQALQFFVDELLQFQEKIGHHSKLTIDSGKVTVEVYTHGVQAITNLDKELAKEADAIFLDSKEI